MTTRGWTHAAAWILLVGAVAWIAKIAVIWSNDGRDLDKGAAAWLMRLGIVGLLLGSTAIGLWTARSAGAITRAVAVVLSPVVLAASTFAIGSVATTLLGGRGPAWLPEEIGIVAAGLVWLAVALWLLSRVRRAPHGAGGMAARL